MPQLGAKLPSPPRRPSREKWFLAILADDAAVEAVFFAVEKGQTLIERHAPQTVHVSMSTISVRLAKRLSEAYAACNRHFISAPVMGRPDVAARAELIVMAAGDAQQIERCRPVLEQIGKVVHNFGAQASQANVAKVTANFMLSSMIQTMAEALALVRKSDLDQEQFYDVIIKDFFASPIYQKYGKIMVDGNFDSGAFTVKGQEKDTRLVLECAQDAQVPLTIASAIENTFLAAIGRGYGQSDPCVIAKLIAENAGVADSAKSNK